MQEEIKNIKSDAALREEAVLKFWKENKIFQKSLEKNSPKGEFVFFDGPPTANGKPGTHHLIPGSFKDVIPRYKTMQGFHVRRKRGWDTHGLPVELQVEKKLGLNSKKAIEEYGVEKFNEECKKSVWEYLDVWLKFTERIGHWVDTENPYVTYHNDYIESVWNVLKKVDDQKLLYKDYRVVPWCPRCGTALSSHELAQGYEDVKDLSVYAKFRLKAVPSEAEGKSPSTGSGQSNINKYLIAWTTTPWTLPGNVALAVGKDIVYVEAKVGQEILVLAKERLSILTEPYEIIAEHKGSEMLGMQYEPLFSYFTDTLEDGEKKKLDKAFKVYTADFVNTTDGTGIVHTAVMYGQDDFALGTEVGLPKHHLVNLEGKFVKGTGPFEGRFVREVDANGKPTLAVDIIEYLKKNNLFFKQENYKHSYPHCWRCHTALIYYARDSWYIRMSDPKVKESLIKENKNINWEPEYIREGRFGEWLREIKDWAISRERYWGTPLPVWQCADCKKVEVVGSLEDLKKKGKKSGNKYFVIRHGESESNVKGNKHGIVSSRAENVDHLTPKGVEQVKEAAEKLKGQNFDLVFVSPFMRTRDTLNVLKETLGLKDNQIIFDKRLGELDAGDFEGKPWDQYRRMFKDERERFLNPIHGGESLQDVKHRMGEVFYEFEEKYQNKNILVVSHGAPLWMLFSVLSGYNVDESIAMTGGVFRHFEQMESGIFGSFKLFANAESRAVDFTPIPHNENYELDLHKPYIDKIVLKCAHSDSSGQDCGGNLVRTKEVMDVWFDSGCMPFAQDHYPFENKKLIDGPGFPADFISEAIDQTRGWFYTLHAVGVLMGRGKTYKNVICLGHLLDAKGKKMSKSLGNVVDPWVMMDKYGVDTLRLWMYSVNQPGESKNFDEKTVALISSQIFTLLYNVLAFYELYRDKNLEGDERPKSKNILDIWILARLDELVKLSTENMDNYKLLEPVRGMRDFIGDLSTWYLRRSRDRIKDGDKDAKQTLYFVLKNISKLLAPFAPFSAEDIWLKLRNEGNPKSVHLSDWPKISKGLFDIFGPNKGAVLSDMSTVRKIVTLGLEARQKAGIKVRQPLSKLEVKDFSLAPQYVELIKDELNVKEVVEDKNLESDVLLDTEITLDLEIEGVYRELVRALQDMRKELGLTPSDVITLAVDTLDAGKELVKKFEEEMKKTVLASKIEFKTNDGVEIKVGKLAFKVKIDK